MPLTQRQGIDHDPVKPWMWGSWRAVEPVEIVSYPCPHADAGGAVDRRATVMIRTTPGDPTTLREVPLREVACFCPTRHEDYYDPGKFPLYKRGE